MCVTAFLLCFSGVIINVERGGLCGEGWIDAQHPLLGMMLVMLVIIIINRYN